MGSTTTQGRPATRSVAAVRVAFHPNYGVGTLIADFRSSIPSPSIPLFTLHWPPRDDQCKTRGRVDRYSFHVRLFHPLFHAGLSRRSTWLFSSTHRTTARSGGFRYKPTMSRTFSTNCGSLENLKFSTRCGCSPKARQIRTMAVCERPVFCAIIRVLQWVLWAGIDSSVLVITSSTCESVMDRGA